MRQPTVPSMSGTTAAPDLILFSVLAIVIAALELTSILAGGFAPGTFPHGPELNASGASPADGVNPGGSAISAAEDSLGSIQSALAAKTAPPPGFLEPMTYDAKDHYVLLFGGPGETWKFVSGSWSKISTPSAPPSFGPMVYDPKTGYVVLLVANETWRFSGGSWSQLHPKHSPPGRFASGIAYDAKDGYVVLFGGLNSSSRKFYGDTWKFSAGDWSKLSTPTAPSARAYVGMAYDSTDGYVLLFGGCYFSIPCGKALADTWKFAGGVWSQLTPTTSPGSRGGLALTDDPAASAILLFGGATSSGNTSKLLRDTWTFAGGTWSQLSPSRSPPARILAAFTYDVKNGYPVLFGGTNNGSSSGSLNDTWKFAGGTWSKI
jgi:hypothetical protein